jgi:hypothetical protein
MTSRKTNEDVTTSSLVRNYQREVERQKLLVRKAETAQRNLLFIVGALRQLLADENFTTLLRAEGWTRCPSIWRSGSGLEGAAHEQTAPGLRSGAIDPAPIVRLTFAQDARRLACLTEIQADHRIHRGGRADRTLSVGKPNREGQHILLDGHTRLVALKQLGFDKAPAWWPPMTKATPTTTGSIVSPVFRSTS